MGYLRVLAGFVPKAARSLANGGNIVRDTSIIVLALLLLPGLNGYAAAEPAQFRQGDYNNGGSGSYRRIIVTTSRKISYDVWQVTAEGHFEHLHFDLVSPAVTPIESDKYDVSSRGRKCGFVSLQLYREGGLPHPDIIVFTYKGRQQPLGSAGRPMNSETLEADDGLIAEVKREADKPHFYDSLTASQRTFLNEDIPHCSGHP
jgi:hypothetical protein